MSHLLLPFSFLPGNERKSRSSNLFVALSLALFALFVYGFAEHLVAIIAEQPLEKTFRDVLATHITKSLGRLPRTHASERPSERMHALAGQIKHSLVEGFPPRSAH